MSEDISTMSAPPASSHPARSGVGGYETPPEQPCPHCQTNPARAASWQGCRDRTFPSPAPFGTIPMSHTSTDLPSWPAGVTACSEDVLRGPGAGGELPHELQPDAAVGACHQDAASQRRHPCGDTRRDWERSRGQPRVWLRALMGTGTMPEPALLPRVPQAQPGCQQNPAHRAGCLLCHPVLPC